MFPRSRRKVSVATTEWMEHGWGGLRSESYPEARSGGIRRLGYDGFCSKYKGGIGEISRCEICLKSSLILRRRVGKAPEWNLGDQGEG